MCVCSCYGPDYRFIYNSICLNNSATVTVTMKELIDFSSLNETFNLPYMEPVWIDWEQCCVVLSAANLPRGWRHTEETKKLMSETAKKQQRTITPERREKLNSGLRRPESRAKNSKANKGRTFSEGTLSKRSETWKGKHGSYITIHNKKLGIKKEGFVSDLAKELELAPNHLSSLKTGKRLSHKGWVIV